MMHNIQLFNCQIDVKNPKNIFPIFQGVLRQSTINDLPVGRSVEETLRLVKAFQFVEKHGEVCPANWQENAPTIKPDPEGSQEYFDKVN